MNMDADKGMCPQMQAKHTFIAWNLDMQPVWMAMGSHCSKSIALCVVLVISGWWRAWCYKRYGVLCSSNLGSSHSMWAKVAARLQMCSHVEGWWKEISGSYVHQPASLSGLHALCSLLAVSGLIKVKATLKYGPLESIFEWAVWLVGM